MELSIWRKWLNRNVLSGAYKVFVLISGMALGILWLPLPLILAMLFMMLAGLIFLVIKGMALFWKTWRVPEFKRVALHVCAVGMIFFAAPIFYLCYKSYFNNLELPLVTLSNGEKTVIFQGMIHIGPSEFYTEIINNLDKASGQGYTLFFEGVESTPAREQWMKRTILRNQDIHSAYVSLADLLGLHVQKSYFTKYKELASRNSSRFVYADVSTQDIFKEYLRLWRESPEFRAEMKVSESKRYPSHLHSFNRITEWQNRGGPARHFLSRRMFLGLYVIALSNTDVENLVMIKIGSSATNKLIFEFRDENLVKRIIEDPSDKIYITYGSAHLPGVVAKLRNSDPKWIVQKREVTKIVLPN